MKEVLRKNIVNSEDKQYIIQNANGYQRIIRAVIPNVSREWPSEAFNSVSKALAGVMSFERGTMTHEEYGNECFRRAITSGLYATPLDDDNAPILRETLQQWYTIISPSDKDIPEYDPHHKHLHKAAYMAQLHRLFVLYHTQDERAPRTQWQTPKQDAVANLSDLINIATFQSLFAEYANELRGKSK